jgi:hypothetical protein
MTTKPTMARAELAKKGADTDLLREKIQFVAQRMMEMDTESEARIEPIAATVTGNGCGRRALGAWIEDPEAV